MQKITGIGITYPEGYEPDTFNPDTYESYRYVIGKRGKNPLVAVCMNPSAARDTISDRKVNRVIQASIDFNYDGWFVVNVYPERATDANMLDEYSDTYVESNVKAVRALLHDYKIREVWGAWGNLKYKQLSQGRDALLKMLQEEKVKVFTFHINKSGNPRHPLYLKIQKENKEYLKE